MTRASVFLEGESLWNLEHQQKMILALALLEDSMKQETLALLVDSERQQKI
jgi:hypothetical protein